MWSADGRYILFAKKPTGNAGDELWRIPAGGGTAERMGGVKPNELIWAIGPHPDGQQLALTVSAPRTELWVLENLLPPAKPAAANRR